jgi:hypothetical protein
VSARCQLNDSGAENVFGGPVHDVKQPVLPCRIAENMRRTIEKCSLVQRLDESERKPVFGLLRQSDLDPVGGRQKDSRNKLGGDLRQMIMDPAGETGFITLNEKGERIPGEGGCTGFLRWPVAVSA